MLDEPLVSTTRLRTLRSALGSGDLPLLISIHDYPDPDAIAAALAMQTLARSWGINSIIAHGGVLGREENTEMVRLLKIDLKTFESVENLDDFRGAVLLDTQPLAKNQSLPANIPILGVIDHHSLGDDSVRTAARSTTRVPGRTATMVYQAIRLSVGARSTLLLGYLEAAGIVPDARLATALFLGIKTDTDGLLRFSGPADVHAYTTLLPLADLSMAAMSIHPPLERSFYRFLNVAVQKAIIYGNTILSNCGEITSPDLLSTASDALIPLKGMAYSRSVGFIVNRAYLSLRAKAPHADATRVLMHIVEPEGKGGGHNLSAGGFLEFTTSPEECIKTIRTRLLEATLDIGSSGENLIETP
ncbi:MAG: DHH family phosphoesterase [Planctomycetes bacterium]|nr:DHH family phosphoesterase [Planctomycetota bacterium]